MTFIYPLGLIGLIGIPILILIYIIKNKYTEQTVSSTYIWNLCEKFLKKKKKLPKIAGLISLIVQLLAVTLISLSIAHPVLVFPNAAEELCFIIDASGSMHIEKDGKTRFEAGKDEIARIIEESMNGSLYTLVRAGDNATSVVFEREDDKEDALAKLEEITCDWGTSRLNDSLKLAQSYFYENRALTTYLITDKNYENHNNIELIDLSGDEDNCAVVSVAQSSSAGTTTVLATVVSHGISRDATVLLYVDGADEPTATKAVSLERGVAQTVTLEASIGGYVSLSVRLAEEDALAADNEIIVYNTSGSSTGTVAIISDTPFFFKSALLATGIRTQSITEIDPEDFDKKPAKGFDLYVFDSYTPAEMPEDGAVWLVNQEKNIPMSGFSIQGEVTPKEAISLELSESSDSATARLTLDMQGGTDARVHKYVKYGIYGDFTTIYSYKKQPIVFAGENGYGNREVVFAFSLHDSNLPLLADFVAMVRNLVTYSFPETLERAGYECGEKLEINLPASHTGLSITSPSGVVEYPASAAAANEYVLAEPGVYTISVEMGDTAREHHVFCELPDAESEITATEKTFSLWGDRGEGGRDGIYDDLIILMIVMAIILTIDWMVYCYDKYQLR